ncbi:MAG TPA: hypothetical protein VFG83_07435 [Kofleriaceae bacterium]|nr:hypothetical protein [Kofleriaceae bacterium]
MRILACVAVASLLACGSGRLETVAANAPPGDESAGEPEQPTSTASPAESVAPAVHERVAKSPTPPPPAEARGLDVASLGPPARDGEAMDQWIAERVARARAGKREWVRVPLVFASDGWGCLCPGHYIGANPDTNAGHANWIRIEASEELAWPKPPTRVIDAKTRVSLGMVVRVDGYLTGETVKEDYGEGGPFLLSVLHVTRVDRAIPMERAYELRVALLEPPLADP